VTEQDPYEEKLEDLVAGLERLNVDAKVNAPKQEEELQRLLEEARSVIAEVRDRRRRREDRELLEQLVMEIKNNTAAAHDRLAASEARLERVEGQGPGRAGDAFPVNPEILKEGAWLKGQLSGPPTDHDTPRFFKDAPVREVPDGLEVLSQAIFEAAPSHTQSSDKEH
jgi:hypothetical protein